MKRTGSTNVHLRRLIHKLRKISRENKAKVWRRVAELLSKPTRDFVEVNISKINRYSSEGETVVVPGKVLGSGELDHSVTVAAWKFSKKAYEKILKKGRALTLQELLEENPNGKGVKIIV